MRKNWRNEVRVQRVANEFRYALRPMLEELPPDQYPPVIKGCDAYLEKCQRERAEKMNRIRAERAGKIRLVPSGKGEI